MILSRRNGAIQNHWMFLFFFSAHWKQSLQFRVFQFDPSRSKTELYYFILSLQHGLSLASEYLPPSACSVNLSYTKEP